MYPGLVRGLAASLGLLTLLTAACNIQVSYDGSAYACVPPDGECPPGYTCGDDGRCALAGDPDGGATPDAPSDVPDAAPAPDAPPPPDPPWWDAAWGFRRRITVTAAAGASLPAGYHALIYRDFDLLPDVSGNFDSLRVVRHVDENDPGTEVDRVYFDLAGEIEELWFVVADAVPAGGSNQQYWLYYGNPTPPPPPNNPADVFDYYASFSAFDASLEIQGGATVTGGELRLDPGESVRTFATFGPGTAVDFQLRLPSWTYRVWGGFQRDGDFLDDEPWMLWITRLPVAGKIQPEVIAYAANVDPVIVGPQADVDGLEHTYSVERFPAAIVFKIDDLERARIPLPVAYATPLQVRLTNEGSSPAFYDLVRIRKVVDPAPAVTLGEEKAPSGP